MAAGLFIYAHAGEKCYQPFKVDRPQQQRKGNNATTILFRKKKLTLKF